MTQFNIQNIQHITVPAYDEIKTMDEGTLHWWLDTLQPYYEARNDILRKYGFAEWQKTTVCAAMRQRLKEINGL